MGYLNTDTEDAIITQYKRMRSAGVTSDVAKKVILADVERMLHMRCISKETI